MKSFHWQTHGAITLAVCALLTLSPLVAAEHSTVLLSQQMVQHQDNSGEVLSLSPLTADFCTAPFDLVQATGANPISLLHNASSCSLEDAETLRAIDDADEEFRWYTLPWLLLQFTAGKLCETAVALTEHPERWTKSRWAMDDPEYAAKYADGAPKRDVLGKLKQAVDARFIDGSSGWYLSLGASKWANSDRAFASLEGGYDAYWTSYFTSRIGLAFAVNSEDFYGGLDLGTRLQVPSRLAPFVGAGLFSGVATKEVPAANDNVDNDDDGFTDEPDETKHRLSGLLTAIYPEAGVHFWWTPRVRLTVYSRYLVTTEGRDFDTWYIGSGLALMSGG